MKVLHVIDSLGVGGGAEHSLAVMLPLLRDRGIDSDVVTIRPRGFGLEVSVAEQGFDVTILPSDNWPGRVRELRRIVQQRSPEVVHATLFNSCMISRIACLGLPVSSLNSLVTTAYDGARSTSGGVAGWKVELVRRVDGLTARRLVDMFHVVSDGIRDEAANRLGVPAERIRHIPRGRSSAALGQPTPQRRLALRRQLDILEDEPVLLNVGRQDHAKNQAQLVRAFGLLQRRRPDAWLLIAGRPGDASGELDSALESLPRPDRVRLLGHRDDVAELYVAADVFVFPSRYEGAAGSVLEAMALSTPVVGSDAPAVAEVLGGGDYGVVTPTDDPQALAAAVEALLDDPERRHALAARARRRFTDEYELESVADAMAAMYRELAGSSFNDEPVR